MLYEEWCKASPLESIFYNRKSLNKCQFDILRFLAENGPHTPYDLWKGPKMGERERDDSMKLGYSYPHIHQNVDELKLREKMIEEKQVVRGGRVKRRLNINFRGLITYFLAWREITPEAKEGISKAITQNGSLLPFSRQWNDIVKIVGEDLAFDGLIKCAETQVIPLKFEIENLNLKFQAFARGTLFSEFICFWNEGDEIRKYHNDEFDRFLAKHNELKNSYIAYLIREDILAFIRGTLQIDSLEDWSSEKELAKFEKRNVHEKPIFPDQRLKEFFPKFAPIEYLFTGMLMDTLLWKKSKVKKKPLFPMEKEGFRVSLLK